MTRLETGHESAADSPGLLLWQVTNSWQSAIRAALRPFDLTHVQFVLLASLTYLAAEGAVTQKRLADHAATDPMMTSQVIRTLEAKALVRRDSDPTDRRAKALTVTRAGADLANRAVVVVEACDRAFFGRLGDGVPSLVRALAVLAR
ncbi:DNA-binding transcriptional regulator, MarR family [Nakamurella panacisegetis]|uniref:DNA-binding transcriptional regulator, MarR family n=1 Tax=Nakamurella panacisegetis TaxID=1090615 RepID=A0A1H0K090_9ACTN|nr:MarR family transcriptional regulator [Nakamurella panacisegetis]SDO49229.1 DNA-binding transcriptional regulator, MarR family [Nakamurella panacisegetis]